MPSQPLRLSCIGASASAASTNETEMGERVKVLDALRAKLQALVYDILPSTIAVFRYAIGS